MAPRVVSGKDLGPGGGVPHHQDMTEALTGYASRSWAALREAGSNPSIRLVVLAYIVFTVSKWALRIAKYVYLYEVAGPFGIAILGLIQMVPSILGVPFASGLGDRFARDRVLAVIYTLCAVVSVALAYVLSAGSDITVFYLLAAAVEVLGQIVRPVQAALLPALARTPSELVAGNVALSTSEAFGALAGPALGAAILVNGGPAAVALVAAAGCAMSVLAITRVHVGSVVQPMAKRVSHGLAGFLAGVGRALRAFARLPASRAIATGFLMQSTVHGMLTVLLVVLAASTLGLGAPGVGTLHAAMGAGGLIAAVFAMGLIGHDRLGPAWALALVGYGLPILLIGLVPSTGVAIVLLTVVGISNALIEVSGFTLLQRTVPDSIRAGVLGAVEGLIGLGYAIGGVLGSVLVERIDIRVAFVVAGAILPIVALLLWSRASRLDSEYVVPEAKLDVLRGLPIFAPLSLAALEHVASGLTETRYPAATTIIREGDPGEAFFVVIDGTAEVIEREQHQADLGPNASFGEVALIRGLPCPATVRTTTDVTAYRLPSADFLSAVTGHPHTAAAAGQVITDASAPDWA
jgi:predicted MFS family arabinose efflux permease